MDGRGRDGSFRRNWDIRLLRFEKKLSAFSCRPRCSGIPKSGDDIPPAEAGSPLRYDKYEDDVYASLRFRYYDQLSAFRPCSEKDENQGLKEVRIGRPSRKLRVNGLENGGGSNRGSNGTYGWPLTPAAAGVTVGSGQQTADGEQKEVYSRQ